MVAACTTAVMGLEGFDTSVVEIGGETLNVAIAETLDQRSQGLMGLESLPDGIDGMLFVYDTPGPRSFHMKNTFIPLDVWWFDGEGFLIGSGRMEPCLNDPCVDYRSPGPAAWVLESPVDEFLFAQGDRLSTG